MTSRHQPPRRGERHNCTARWGDGGPRRTGWDSPERLPRGSKHGDFQATYNIFQDKHCIYPLSHLLTFAFQIGRAIIPSHKIFLDHEAESWLGHFPGAAKPSAQLTEHVSIASVTHGYTPGTQGLPHRLLLPRGGAPMGSEEQSLPSSAVSPPLISRDT